jgi:hypothetical protein
VGARFSSPALTGPRSHPASCSRGVGSFPGIKEPGRGVDYLPSSGAEVKERLDLYLSIYDHVEDFILNSFCKWGILVYLELIG